MFAKSNKFFTLVHKGWLHNPYRPIKSSLCRHLYTWAFSFHHLVMVSTCMCWGGKKSWYLSCMTVLYPGLQAAFLRSKVIKPSCETAEAILEDETSLQWISLWFISTHASYGSRESSKFWFMHRHSVVSIEPYSTTGLADTKEACCLVKSAVTVKFLVQVTKQQAIGSIQ